MTRTKKNGSSTAEDMNLMPMIDVTFLLLVFFLVGCNFKKPEGKLNAYLPKSEGPPPSMIVTDPVEELVIRIRMKPDHEYAIFQIGELEYLSIGELEQRLKTLYDASKTQKDPVTIDPDSTASYEDVLHVLNSCVRVGFKEITFAPPSPEGPVKANEAQARF